MARGLSCWYIATLETVDIALIPVSYYVLVNRASARRCDAAHISAFSRTSSLVRMG